MTPAEPMTADPAAPDAQAALPPRTKPLWRRLLPLAFIGAGILAFFLSGLDQYLSFSALKDHRVTLLEATQARPILSGVAFVLIYATATALSLPIASALTILSGFLFGAVLGGGYAVIGATIGASILFLAARSAIGGSLRAKAGPWLVRLQDGFQRDSFSYLLFLRLVPAFPFVIVNLVPALLGVRLTPFVAATLIGIIPGSFVYAFAGVGLGSVLDRGEAFSLTGILTPEMTLALAALGVLALIPVFLRRWKARSGAAPRS